MKSYFILLGEYIVLLFGFNTHTGGGRFSHFLHLFYANKSKISDRQIYGNCAQIKNSLYKHFELFGQIVRSPSKVNVRCATRDWFQTSRSCCSHSCSPNVLKLSEWDITVDTCTECRFRIFHFCDLRSGHFLTQPIIGNPMGKVIFCS